MIALLLLVLALASTPEPSTPPVTSSPLKEIGRVRALPACTTLVVHANSAIDSALRNDNALAVSVNRLKHVDLDANALSRSRGLNELMGISRDMRKQAVEAEGEVKRLREIAATSEDATRKEELKSFADALGGAVFRQKRAADDLARFVVITEGRVAKAEAHMDMQTGKDPTQDGLFKPAANATLPPYSPSPLYLNETARDAAKEFEAKIALIVADEAKAADHSIGATSGC
jgi:hypothetical protein